MSKQLGRRVPSTDRSTAWSVHKEQPKPDLLQTEPVQSNPCEESPAALLREDCLWTQKQREGTGLRSH